MSAEMSVQANSKGGAERRRDKRLDADLPASIEIAGEKRTGTLKNISRGGAAIAVLGVPPALETMALLQLGSPGGSYHFSLPGRVLAVRGSGDSQSVHLRFEELDKDQLRFLAALMNSLLPGELRESGALAAPRSYANDAFREEDVDSFFLSLRVGAQRGVTIRGIEENPDLRPGSGLWIVGMAFLVGAILASLLWAVAR